MPIEVGQGAVNGSNTLFEVAADYRPGTVIGWINGQLKVSENDDGLTELGGRRIRLKEAPLVGDVIQFFYIAL